MSATAFEGKVTTVMIMAGGTGGHVYPALSVAKALREKSIQVVWLGTKKGLEARVIPSEGFDIEWIDASAVVGIQWSRKIMIPWMIVRAVWQSLKVIWRQKPSVVLGMGGFVAGPGGVAAWLLRRPLIIHEANARSGLTNRMLTMLATKVLTGFSCSEGMPRSAEHTGNPVRPEIALIPAPSKRGIGVSKNLRVLVLGGSQGARTINDLVPHAFAMASCRSKLQILHQSGRNHDDQVRDLYRTLDLDASVIDFIDEMSSAYESVDLVISRAGAMTISEISTAGLPAILIPYPHSAGDHQYANARCLVEAGAAVVFRESELKPGRLADEIDRFFLKRGDLMEMAQAARTLARPEATNDVTNQCLELARA